MVGVIKAVFGGFWGAIHCVMILFWLVSLSSDLPEAAGASRVLIIAIMGLALIRMISTAIWRQRQLQRGKSASLPVGPSNQVYEPTCPHCGSTRYPVKREVGS